ncbi:MAG: hypothetical protein IPL40_05665 [Proteobacteria bacterium]|nr:hypothetical protein [Pseudomonadota bacterium]
MSAHQLIDQATASPDPERRREAFLALLQSERWSAALVAAVVGSQTVPLRGSRQPDWIGLRQAASTIATDEEKVQCCLELAGQVPADALLLALARQMGSGLVESALSHLRTAEGSRRQMLNRVLQEADPAWVDHPAAGQTIRRQLASSDGSRGELMTALARAGTLGTFTTALHRSPPTTPEEWNALGRAKLVDPDLINLALALLARVPGTLLYLARLPEPPAALLPRMLAAATPEWTMGALDLAMQHSADCPALVPLATLSVQRGGAGFSYGLAWTSASKLGRSLLALLGERLRVGGPTGLVDQMLRSRSQLTSANRALAQGRRGEAPDALDAAALVRQLTGEKARAMAREILEEPRLNLVEPVLHHLCAVRDEAAREVAALCTDARPEVAARAQQACAWPDVRWSPNQLATMEVPID